MPETRARELADFANNTAGLETLTVSDITDLTATATELNHSSGVGSALQTQIDAKAPTASPTFTGSITIGDIFWQSGKTVTASYSIPANKNAGSFGEITINSGVTVTIPTTSSWTIAGS